MLYKLWGSTGICWEEAFFFFFFKCGYPPPHPPSLCYIVNYPRHTRGQPWSLFQCGLWEAISPPLWCWVSNTRITGQTEKCVIQWKRWLFQRSKSFLYIIVFWKVTEMGLPFFSLQVLLLTNVKLHLEKMKSKSFGDMMWYVEDLEQSTKRKNRFSSLCMITWCMNRNLDQCHFLCKFTKGELYASL